MCVLTIKVPIRKTSGNLSYAPSICTFYSQQNLEPVLAFISWTRFGILILPYRFLFSSHSVDGVQNTLSVFPLAEGYDPIKYNVLPMTRNYIWCFTFSWDLYSMVYPFVAIIPRVRPGVLVLVKVPSVGQIDWFKHNFLFNSVTWREVGGLTVIGGSYLHSNASFKPWHGCLRFFFMLMPWANFNSSIWFSHK